MEAGRDTVNWGWWPVTSVSLVGDEGMGDAGGAADATEFRKIHEIYGKKWINNYLFHVSVKILIELRIQRRVRIAKMDRLRYLYF